MFSSYDSEIQHRCHYPSASATLRLILRNWSIEYYPEFQNVNHFTRIIEPKSQFVEFPRKEKLPQTTHGGRVWTSQPFSWWQARRRTFRRESQKGWIPSRWWPQPTWGGNGSSNCNWTPNTPQMHLCPETSALNWRIQFADLDHFGEQHLWAQDGTST